MAYLPLGRMGSSRGKKWQKIGRFAAMSKLRASRFDSRRPFSARKIDRKTTSPGMDILERNF